MASTVFGRVAVPFACLAVAIACPQPAAAQSLEELDRLVQASVKPKEGLLLAQTQASGGALLDALATLERVLASDPKNKQAKLLHATLLCRVDDRDGATLEFGQLKPKDYKKAEWAAAHAPCQNEGAVRP